MGHAGEPEHGVEPQQEDLRQDRGVAEPAHRRRTSVPLSRWHRDEADLGWRSPPRCNAFGFALDDASVRRAAVEGVPETVIAAIYLLHERSVGEIAAKLRPDELEHVIGLVGRCPSCYPPGALDDLKSRRAAPVTPLTGTLPPKVTAKEEAAAHPHPQHRRPPPRPEARQGTTERPKRLNAPPKPKGFQEGWSLCRNNSLPDTLALQLSGRQTLARQT